MDRQEYNTYLLDELQLVEAFWFSPIRKGRVLIFESRQYTILHEDIDISICNRIELN